MCESENDTVNCFFYDKAAPRSEIKSNKITINQCIKTMIDILITAMFVIYRLGASYGHGVYFSSSARYSHSYTTTNTRGERCMFLARVLIGKTAIGSSSIITCPDGYDTTTNGSHIYVIYHDAQAFGEYLITYR